MLFQRNLLLVAAGTIPSSISAFTVIQPYHRSTTCIASSTTVDTDAVALSPKESVLSTARQCRDAFGLFLVDKTAKRELAESVEALELTYDTTSSHSAVLSPGTWDLVCTTSTSTQGIDTQQFLPPPLKDLTDKLSTAANKYVTVQQRLKGSTDTSETVVDRIDHVIAYAPPQSLTEVLENVPQALLNFKVNPLDVSKSQLILVHKASSENDTTSLTLQSVIWNVAGNSTYLDPAGQDITSINLPSFATDFLASGSFTTTYQDEDLRIVRGKQGPLDFLRIFVKSTSLPEVMDVEDIPDAEIVEDILAAEAGSGGDDDVPSDVGSAGP